MIKVFCLLCAALFVGQFAQADDGGVVGISVKDLQVSSVSYGGNNPVTTPLPVNDTTNFQITLNGGEAAKLMLLLPPQESVITGQYPKFAKTYNANFRTLEIRGAKNQPAVSIICEGGELTFGGADGQTPSFKAFKDGPHCQVLAAPVTEEEISFNFNPVKNVCGK